MIGLEILETIQEISLSIPLMLFAIAFTVFVLIGAIAGASCDNCDDFGKKLYSWVRKGYLAGIIAVGLYVTLFSFVPDSYKYETVYKATISDEVSYNEFTEKYEIISEKDGVYKIKEIPQNYCAKCGTNNSDISYLFNSNNDEYTTCTQCNKNTLLKHEKLFDTGTNFHYSLTKDEPCACGNKINESDKFCSHCGIKLVHWYIAQEDSLTKEK